MQILTKGLSLNRNPLYVHLIELMKSCFNERITDCISELRLRRNDDNMLIGLSVPTFHHSFFHELFLSNVDTYFPILTTTSQLNDRVAHPAEPSAYLPVLLSLL